MGPKELTAHRRDRARFVLAAQRAGKLAHADAQVLREVRLFTARSPAGTSRPQVRARSPRSAARRTRAGVSRDGPGEAGGDDPPPPPLTKLDRDWIRGLDDDELIRAVRGLNAVDRAVNTFRKGQQA